VPRRSILSVAERESLLSLPASQDDLIRHYSLSESDLSLVRRRRGASNRLGFAILLSYMRYPGIILGVGDEAYAPLLSYVAQQVNVDAAAWKRYGQREQTRREHLLELQEVFGFKPFTGGHYRSAVAQLADVALQTDKGIVLATTLVESLRNEVVCAEHDIAGYIPDPAEGLLPIDQAIALALRHTREGEVSTRWSSAGTPGAPSDPLPSDPSWAGGSLYVDARISVVRASPRALWRIIEGIGGETGWYSFPAAWAVRGLLDRLAGGVGLRRGRRDPRRLLVGDALDFWRVEAITPGSLLRLRAEMKLPGLAWLEMSVGRDHDGMTTYSQRAIFQPRGLAGHVYWRSIAPFHGVVFGGMLRNITQTAERADRWADKPAPAPSGS